jgi:hypothetical protein
MRKQTWILSLTLVVGVSLSAFAQESAAPGKTPKSTVLIFREDFRENKGGEVQLSQNAITNPNVELKVYGPGSKPGNANQSGLLLSYEEDTVHPGKMESYIFTGVVEASWGLMLKDKNNYMDLRDTARLIWRTRARSLHELRVLVKLTDGTMWASDYTERLSTYMHESEVFFGDILRWRQINPETMEEARAKPGEPLWKTNLDLSRVDEIGFSDLMAGAGHGTQGNVSVDWIEVYGNPVKRNVSTSQAR